MPKQNKMIQKVYKKHCWVNFVVANYSCAWGLPWCVVNWPSKTPLEKTNFPLASRYRLHIASWLGVRTEGRHMPSSKAFPHGSAIYGRISMEGLQESEVMDNSKKMVLSSYNRCWNFISDAHMNSQRLEAYTVPAQFQARDLSTEIQQESTEGSS